jgi:hypothetical protein
MLSSRQWNRATSRLLRSLLLPWLLLGLPACRTVPPLGPANLQTPGWTVRQGQAVWQRPHGAPELAGEILVGTGEDGRLVVQFSKNGFPLLIAQSRANDWQVELPIQNKRYSGRGLPPARLLILYLPRALAGLPLPQGWSWNTMANGGWRLENHRTGESLEGYFNP